MFRDYLSSSMPKPTSNWLLCQLSQMFFPDVHQLQLELKNGLQVPSSSIKFLHDLYGTQWKTPIISEVSSWISWGLVPMKRFPHISQKELEKPHLSKTKYLFVGYGIVCFVVNNCFYVDFQEFSLCCWRRDVLWPQTKFLLVISFEPKKSCWIFSVPSNLRRCLRNFRHPSNSIQ